MGVRIPAEFPSCSISTAPTTNSDKTKWSLGRGKPGSLLPCGWEQGVVRVLGRRGWRLLTRFCVCSPRDPDAHFCAFIPEK